MRFWLRRRQEGDGPYIGDEIGHDVAVQITSTRKLCLSSAATDTALKRGKRIRSGTRPRGKMWTPRLGIFICTERVILVPDTVEGDTLNTYHIAISVHSNILETRRLLFAIAVRAVTFSSSFDISHAVPDLPGRRRSSATATQQSTLVKCQRNYNFLKAMASSAPPTNWRNSV
ncbi:hypothetical protein CPB85DRAFT_367443 [Mucidula mucida]|nr:hypothetical protein CPB85DRAFT_367443 [Mucidula mucida]